LADEVYRGSWKVAAREKFCKVLDVDATSISLKEY